MVIYKVRNQTIKFYIFSGDHTYMYFWQYLHQTDPHLIFKRIHCYNALLKRIRTLIFFFPKYIKLNFGSSQLMSLTN